MSITDELREYAHDCCARIDDDIHAIADRIDAEHEAKVAYWQEASYKDGYDEGFASADDWLAQHEDAMAEHGWMRRPVAHDGKPWYVFEQFETSRGEIKTVAYVCEDGIITKDGTHYTAACYDHHHAPTVEDVLREFTDAIFEWAGKSGTVAEVGTWSDVAAEYAAKLQLREGHR